MVTLSIVGIVWAVVGLIFVWMIVRYGISQGKERDVAREFESEEVKQAMEEEKRKRRAS